MKFVSALLCALLVACSVAISASPAKEKKPYVVYAQFLDPKEVQLSDGSVWLMDKGDCFPIHMFKDQQRVVVLKLATATFATEAYHVRVMKDNEAAAAEAKYQENVDNYWKAVAARKTKAEAEEKQPASTTTAP